MTITRRKILIASSIGLAAASTGLSSINNIFYGGRDQSFWPNFGSKMNNPVILIRSVWQWQNIGDIAHGLGIVNLVRKNIPNAKIYLWTNDLSNSCRIFLEKSLNGVEIIETGNDIIKLRYALTFSDFLISSSSSGFSAHSAIERWLQIRDRPFVIFGITIESEDSKQLNLMKKARFAYFRDSTSLKKAYAVGIKDAAFVPDDAFSSSFVRNTGLGIETCERMGLTPKSYVCCIPRFRYTPVWSFKNMPVDSCKAIFNEAHVEQDHSQIRNAMISAVRNHGVKLLICPEDLSQIQLGREILFDKLPDDVKSSTQCLDRFWLPDEAISVFANSAALLSADQHSPIMAIACGVPAILCRSKEQSSKGLMWKDIGLTDWLFDFDNPDRMSELPQTLDNILARPKAAEAKATKALNFVRELQNKRMANVAKIFGDISQ